MANRPGRPPKSPDERKSARLAPRVSETLRKQLEEAARENGRTLSQEAEFRLSVSFAPDVTGSRHTPQTLAIIELLAEAITRVEDYTGQRWQKNRFTHDLVRRTINLALGYYEPSGTKRAPSEFPILMRQQPGPSGHLPRPNRQEQLNRKRMRTSFLKDLDHLPTIVADSLASFVHASGSDPAAPFPNVFRRAAGNLGRRLKFDETPAPPTLKSRRRKP